MAAHSSQDVYLILNPDVLGQFNLDVPHGQSTLGASNHSKPLSSCSPSSLPTAIETNLLSTLYGLKQTPPPYHFSTMDAGNDPNVGDVDMLHEDPVLDKVFYFRSEYRDDVLIY